MVSHTYSSPPDTMVVSDASGTWWCGATDNRLFSTNSNILPINKPNYSQNYREICKVLEKVTMPFLNTSVVVAKTNCPSLSDGERILGNIYHSHQQISLLTLLNKEDLNTIIRYFISCKVMP